MTSAGSKGPTRGLLGMGASIIKEEGLLKLYRGLTPACLRHCVYSGIRVGVYEALREHVFLKVGDFIRD